MALVANVGQGARDAQAAADERGLRPAPVREDVAVQLRRLGSTSRAVDKAVVAKIVRINRKVKQAARAAKDAAKAA